ENEAISNSGSAKEGPLRLTSFYLGAVLGTRLFAVSNPLRIEHATDDMIANARQIAHASAAHQNNRVLLQIMAFTGDVRCHFDAVGQADAGYLPQSGVRLLRCHDLDLQADTAFLWTSRHGRVPRAAGLRQPRLAD